MRKLLALWLLLASSVVTAAQGMLRPARAWTAEDATAYEGRAVLVEGNHIAAALAVSPGGHAQSFYDGAFDEVMARYRLPGLAVGIVRDGKVIFRHTAGETIAGFGQRITPETLFKIASNSKAMTTSVLARLVDAGLDSGDEAVVPTSTAIFNSAGFH